MQKRNLVLAVGLALAVGCVAPDDEGDGWVDRGGKADDGGGYPALIINESGDGQVFDVLDGQDVIVQLPSSPTTGHEWVVAETDRTFGYPYSIDYLAPSRGQGSGGVTHLTWKTRSFAPMTGRHTVVLELRRHWEDPRVTAAADSFSFTVEIHRAGFAAVVIEDADDGEIFDVVQGQDVIVRLEENPATGYEWTVAYTDRTLGYPEYVTYVPVSEATGAGGYTEMMWRTESPRDMAGKHSVRLELRRPWEPAEIASVESFGFSVLIAGVEE
jgi:predicted secreted protein